MSDSLHPTTKGYEIWAKATDIEKQAIREIVDEIKPKNKELREKAKKILAFLNFKAGRNYRECDTNLKFIVDRLRDGIEEDQLRQIIVKKSREWRGTDMELYLRPSTLFNRTKCEQYFGELV